MRFIKLILLSLFVVGMAPADVFAQGVSGRGISGNSAAQIGQACQVEVDDMTRQIREVTNRLERLLECNRQDMIRDLDGNCREARSPAHNWTDTTLAFSNNRVNETGYNWASGVDLRGDKGPKGESITCYSPDNTPPPPPPPGNKSCTFTYFDSGNVTVNHGNTVSAYTTPDGYKAGNNMCATNRYTVSCNNGSFNLVSGQYNRTPVAIVPSPSAGIDRGYKNCKMCGSYDPDWCGFTNKKRCELPWGGQLDHGQSVTAYQASSAPACRSQSRTCDDGTLSGSYEYRNCQASGGGQGSRCCNHGVGWYECGRQCCHNSRSDNRSQHPLMLCANPEPNCCPSNMEFLGHGEGGSDGFWGSKCRDWYGNITYYMCE